MTEIPDKLILANERFVGRLFLSHGNPKPDAPVADIEPSVIVPLPVTTRGSAWGSCPTMKEIIEETAEFYEVTIPELLSDSRTKDLARVRMVAMYLCRTMTRASYPAIGLRLMRDHSTVIHGYTSIKNQRRQDARLNDEMQVIELRIRQRRLNRGAAA